MITLLNQSWLTLRLILVSTSVSTIYIGIVMFSLGIIVNFYLIGTNISFSFLVFIMVAYGILYPIYYLLFNYINNYINYLLNNFKSSFLLIISQIGQPFISMIYLYMFFIFLIRQFFIRERPWIIYLIGGVFLINLLYPNHFFTHFTMIQYILFNAILGANLISIDNLGSFFSDILINHSETTFAATYLSLTKRGLAHSHVIIRTIVTRSIAGIIFGKTPMTSTGRATIGVAVISGAGYLYNEHLNRKSTESIATANRKSSESIAAANRISSESIAAADRASQDRATALQREEFEYRKAQDAKKSSWFGK